MRFGLMAGPPISTPPAPGVKPLDLAAHGIGGEQLQAQSNMEIDMKTRSHVAATLVLALLGAGGWSVAASPSRGADGTKSGSPDPMHSMMMSHMMDSGMMGGCPMMGQLPPGNEKLSMQMHGEMMQAMGEILRKYADKIQTSPSK